MKNCIKAFLALAAAAAASASCQKSVETIPSSIGEARTLEFFTEEPAQTKTVFGTPDGSTYPTLWTADAEAKVKVNINASTTTNEAGVTPSADFKTASFRATVNPAEAAEYVIRVVSPADAALGYAATGWNISVPTTQTPTATSVDEAAMILVGKSATFTTFPAARFPVPFTHFTAYGKISITNLEAGAVVSSITLTAEENWAGRFNYNDGAVSEKAASSTITINTASTANVWFACAPVDLTSKNVEITVTTDRGDYKKTITFPAGKGNFQSGKIAKFAVDFSGVTTSAADVYSLVTSTDALTIGSQVIIASGNNAISTTQNTNNRAATAVTVADNKITNPSASVQVFELKSGEVDETVAFFDGAGYIYAASSGSNYLKTQTTNNANGSFSVSFNGNNIDLKAQGTNTRNWIRFNDGTPSNLVFSCYGSGQKDVQLYKLDGSGTSTPAIVVKPSLTAPTINASGNDAAKTITVTWTDVANATSYLVECGTQKETVAAGVQTKTFTMDSFGTYDIYVTAQADGYKSAKSSKASVTLTDSSAPSTSTVTFVAADFNGQGTSGSGGAVSVTKSGITVSANKGYGTTQFRAYQGSSLEVTSTVGNIKSISFTFSGSYKGGLDVKYDNINAASWTQSSLASQARITQIEVEVFE